MSGRWLGRLLCALGLHDGYPRAQIEGVVYQGCRRPTCRYR